MVRNFQANRAFSLTWPASMKIYGKKRKRLHKKRVQLPQEWFGTPTWPPFHCFGTPIWPPWRHVKTLYNKVYHCKLSKENRCLRLYFARLNLMQVSGPCEHPGRLQPIQYQRVPNPSLLFSRTRLYHNGKALYECERWYNRPPSE